VKRTRGRKTLPPRGVVVRVSGLKSTTGTWRKGSGQKKKRKGCRQPTSPGFPKKKKKTQEEIKL